MTEPTLPPTLARLLACRPGERVIYYVGQLPADIHAAEHCGYYRTPVPPAPLTAALLRRVSDTAQGLQAAGKLHLSERRVVRQVAGRDVIMTEYAAKGVEAGRKQGRVAGQFSARSAGVRGGWI